MKEIEHFTKQKDERRNIWFPLSFITGKLTSCLALRGANVLSLALKTMFELVNMSLCWTRRIKIALMNNNSKPFPFFQDSNLDPA